MASVFYSEKIDLALEIIIEKQYEELIKIIREIKDKIESNPSFVDLFMWKTRLMIEAKNIGIDITKI